MAITIVQGPYEFTPLRQKLIVLATSTNTANTGFQYKVVVQVDTTTIYTGYHAPNPVDALVVDIREIIEEYVYLTSASLLGQGSTIHSQSSTTNIFGTEVTGSRRIDVVLTEAWISAGVLTDDPGAAGSQTHTISCVWPASYQHEDGYRPDPAASYALTTSTDQVLTDRTPDTHFWDLAASKGFTVSSSFCYIPVYETDYGVISIPIDSGSALIGNNADRVVITIHKADASTASATINITPTANIAHFAVYPANINDSSIAALTTVKPSANAGWVALSILFESSIGTDVSQTYILYNTELFGQNDCLYPRIRLGWANSRGGWDYFNFIKKSEQSVQVERRRFRQIAGNYGSANGSTAFNFSSYDRGLRESKPKVQRAIEINTDWISEGEFELLKWLVVSNQVHWIQDDGTVIPVVVENNDYVSRVFAKGKLYNQSLRLRLAHDLNV